MGMPILGKPGHQTKMYPHTLKLVNDFSTRLEREKLTPWMFMPSGKPFKIEDCRERKISYQGIEFSGSAREVFWRGYIEPCLEDGIISIFEEVSNKCNEKGVGLNEHLDEAAFLLKLMVKKVYMRMADIDQRLRGKGFPQSVKKRDVSKKIESMARFIDDHLGVAKYSKKNKNVERHGWYWSLKDSYDNNQPLFWFAGLLASALIGWWFAG